MHLGEVLVSSLVNFLQVSSGLSVHGNQKKLKTRLHLVRTCLLEKGLLLRDTFCLDLLRKFSKEDTPFFFFADPSESTRRELARGGG